MTGAAAWVLSLTSAVPACCSDCSPDRAKLLNLAAKYPRILLDIALLLKHH